MSRRGKPLSRAERGAPARRAGGQNHDERRRGPAEGRASAADGRGRPGAGRGVVRGAGGRPGPARRAEPRDPSPAPATLNELLAAAQRLSAEGAEQEEVIEWVRSVAEQRGLRARHDQHAEHAVPACLEPTAAEPGPAAADPEPAAPAELPAGEQPAPAAAAEPPAGGQPAPAEPGAKRRRAGGQRPGVAVAAPVVSRADGGLQLDLGRVLDGPAPPPAGVAGPPARRATATAARLMLSGNKQGGARGRSEVPLSRECNGVVVDARTWRALAVPPCAFNAAPAAKVVDELLAEGAYDIFRVDDGTVVTLYCWLHPADGLVWALASSNGYDVSSLRWTGPRTYAELFHDLATRLYPDFVAATGLGIERKSKDSTRLTFATLDPRRCYTVGFRHHDFHPLVADPERIWQIQHTDLSGADPVVFPGGAEGGLPGVPGQAPHLPFAFGEPPSLDTLRGFLQGAVAAATAALSGPAPAPHSLNYGFILRSRDRGRTGAHSDILVESPLLARVRRLVYERPPRAVRDELDPAERLEYSAMRAYLTAGERADFLALFPAWAPRFQAYGELVANVTRLVIHDIRQRAMAPASREPAFQSPTGRVALALAAHIRRHESLSAFHRDTEGIVRDYVTNPEYALLLIRALRGEPARDAPAADS